jgi:hypothetical protein
MTIEYIYWDDEEYWMGYLEEYPDYITQGMSLEELQENLKDLYVDLSSENSLNNTTLLHNIDKNIYY